MTQRQNKAPTAKGVEAGAVDAYQNLPTGLTYDTVLMRTNFHPKGMKNIRVKVGTRTIQTFLDGEELEKWNKRYNRRTNVAEGYTHFHFVRPELHDYVERRLTAIGTGDFDDFRIVFNLDENLVQLDGATALAVEPTVDTWTIRSEQQPLGVFTRITAHQENFGTTGEQIWDDLEWRGRLAGLHLVGLDVTDWTLQLDDVEFHQTESAVNEEFAQVAHFPRATIANWQHLDFIAQGETDEALIGALYKDKRLTFTNGTAGKLRVLVETFDAMEAA